MNRCLIAEKLTLAHPDFAYCTVGKYPFIFIFSRTRYKTPDELQTRKYRESEAIVESLGGHMDLPEWKIAGESAVFSNTEIHSMRICIEARYPELSFAESWNGVGCYTASFGFYQERP